MSDHEVETIVWDEFHESDQQVVPHYGDEQLDETVDLGGFLKKPQHGIENDVEENTDNASCKVKDAMQKKEAALCHPSRDGNSSVPESSWTRASRKMIPISYAPESNSNPTVSVSQNDNWPNNYLEQYSLDTQNSTFCSENPIFGTVGDAEEGKNCLFPLDEISLADAEFTSVEYEPRGKENDLLYDNFPDICVFDDMDIMLRDCDSPFKQVSSNANEISWFSSSSQRIFGPEETWRSGLGSSVSKSLEGTSVTHGASTNLSSQNHPTMAGNEKFDSLTYESFALVNDAERSAPVERAYDGVGVAEISPAVTQLGNPNSLNECENLDMIPLHIKQLKSQHPSEGNGKKDPSECDSNISFHGPDQMQQVAGQKHLPVFSVHQPYSSELFQKQNKIWGSDSSSCMKTISPHAQLDDSLPPYQDLFMQNSSSMTYGIGSSASSSCEGTSHVRSHTSWCIDKLPIPLSETPVVIPNNEMISERRLKENSCAASTVKHLPQPSVTTNIASAQKQHKFPAREMTSSTVREISSMTSVSCDGTSLEAIYFQQLQDVVNQLVARTKLCIRDGLYRLATSAEQRYNFAYRNSCGGDTTRRILGNEESNCLGYMAVEIETNPVDRAIAHLLFHGSSEPATRPIDHDM